MVALPSFPERTSRAEPVAVFTTETFASFTMAPSRSTTVTIMVDVLGDCAATVAAKKAKSDSRSRRKLNRFLGVNLDYLVPRRAARTIDSSPEADWFGLAR